MVVQFALLEITTFPLLAELAVKSLAWAACDTSATHTGNILHRPVATVRIPFGMRVSAHDNFEDGSIDATPPSRERNFVLVFIGLLLGK
jgi:hypothetical protein